MRISDWSSDVCASDLPGSTMVGIPARPVPVDTVHYSPGFVPYGTPCGEDCDPGRLGLSEMEREIAEPRRAVESLTRTLHLSSEGRRAGEECVSTGETMWTTYN